MQPAARPLGPDPLDAVFRRGIFCPVCGKKMAGNRRDGWTCQCGARAWPRARGRDTGGWYVILEIRAPEEP